MCSTLLIIVANQVTKSGTLHARRIEHEHFNLKEVLNSELKQAKEIMDAIPGGRRATTVTTEEDFSLAIKRLKFLREYK